MDTNDKSKLRPLRIDEIVQGRVVNSGKAAVYLDLGAWGTGIIYGREFYDAKDKLKGLQTGDVIFVKVIDLENDEGYIELSLTKAGKELAWEQLRENKEKDELIKVKILGANKGGLLAKVHEIPAFLPVSQLSQANYPKVEGGDSQKILKSLQKFIGKELDVKIFDFSPKEEKLILSEKAKDNERLKDLIKNYNIGDVVDVEITGIVDFGAFVRIPLNPPADGEEIDGLEGLIHISELDWQLIEDPSEIVKVGEKLKAKIIDITNGKISLSLKSLKINPWENIEEKFKKGGIVEGKVTKFNPFGAFIQLTDKIQGLCHVSEFGSQKKMEESLKINKKYSFKILLIDPKEHRLTLKLAEDDKTDN